MAMIYFTAIAIISIISAIIPIGTMFAYGANNPLNQACYNSGFTDGQKNNAYNQGQFSQCGINGKAYYEGFINGCISGQGKSFFSCQQLTNSPLGGGSGNGVGLNNNDQNNNDQNNNDQNNNDQNNNDQNNNDQKNNTPPNQACYNSGFTDGQKNNAYNQGQFSQCGINGKA